MTTPAGAANAIIGNRDRSEVISWCDSIEVGSNLGVGSRES